MRHFMITINDVPGADFFISKIEAAQNNSHPQILEYKEVSQQTVDYIQDMLVLLVEAKNS